MHQLGGVVLGERRLHLPGPQQCFGYGPQLLNVITALDGSLLHRECELPAEGRLFHGLAQRLNNTLQTPASRLRGGYQGSGPRPAAALHPTCDPSSAPSGIAQARPSSRDIA